MRIINSNYYKSEYSNCVYPSSSDNPPEPEIKAYCINCNTPIRQTDEYEEDEEGRVFCESDCTRDYYIKNGIIKLKTMD